MPSFEQRKPEIIPLLRTIIASQQIDSALNRPRRNETFSPAHIPRIDPRIATPLPRWQDVERYLGSDTNQPPWLPSRAPGPQNDMSSRSLLLPVMIQVKEVPCRPARSHSVTGRPLDPASGPRFNLQLTVLGNAVPRRARWPAHGESQPGKVFVAEQGGQANAGPARAAQHVGKSEPAGYKQPETLKELSRDLLERRVPYSRVLLKAVLRRFVAHGGYEAMNREILRFLDQLRDSQENQQPGGKDYELMALRVVCELAQERNNLSLCEAILARPRTLDALNPGGRRQRMGFFRREDFRKLYADALDRVIAARVSRPTFGTT
ncbi:MAG: hypothetical protein Q8N17_03100 [Burkholderiaceae bacterium]|nr:hypothetical protein [Burkholderiaceae bacterium]